MGLNEVDDYFRRDTELQNYTDRGEEDHFKIIFNFHPCVFAIEGKNMHSGYF